VLVVVFVVVVLVVVVVVVVVVVLVVVVVVVVVVYNLCTIRKHLQLPHVQSSSWLSCCSTVSAITVRSTSSVG